jgi:pimeloyl-ACP methyl ester carboxylesterase
MPENYDNYSSALSTVKYYMINDCAHFPWVETPAEYFEILQQTIVD